MRPQANITVPKLAVNNYLRPGRLQLSDSQVTTTPYFENWPVALPIAAGEFSSSLRCPAELHLIAWPLRNKDGNVDVGVHSLSKQENIQDAPGPSDEEGEASVQLVAVQDDQLRSAAVYTAALPSRGSYIFVPRGHAVRFRCAALAEDCIMAALCMVDASNLNLFRAALARQADQSEHAAALHAAISSPSFSVAQDRSPADIELHEYAAATSRADLPDSVAGGSGETGAPSQASSGTDSGTGRRNRRKRGNDFKDWQAQSKWNMLITALTLPSPSAPTVVRTLRDGLEVVLRSDFVPTAGDKTRFGFLVTACPLNSATESGAPQSCVDNIVLRGDRASSGETAHLEEELDRDVLRRSGAEAVLYRATVSGLLPGTAYELRAALLYDQSQSSLSGPSAACRTAQLSPPAWPGSEGATVRVLASEEPAFDAHTGEEKARLVGMLHFTWPTGEEGHRRVVVMKLPQLMACCCHLSLLVSALR